MGDFGRLVTVGIIGTRAVVLLAGLGVAASACDSSTVTATEARGRIAFLAAEPRHSSPRPRSAERAPL